MLWQGGSIRTLTGHRIKKTKGKKRREMGSSPAETHIGVDRAKIVRTFGGGSKVRSLRQEFASVCDRNSGSVQQAKIEKVEENRANPNYVRRNLLTKGAIIRTSIGKARITSRPGQDGVINAVLIE